MDICIVLSQSNHVFVVIFAEKAGVVVLVYPYGRGGAWRGVFERSSDTIF